MHPDPPLQSSPRRRVLVLYNPAAGHARGKLLGEVLSRLNRLGAKVHVRQTERRGDAGRLAAGLAEGEFDVVVAAGGDGTINEVVNGLVANAAPPPLAVVPLGNANVLACEIGLDADDGEAIADAIAFGKRRRVHLGTANGRHFALMAGAGFDAHVVEAVSSCAKGESGRMAYLFEGLRQAWAYDHPPLTVRADRHQYQGSMVVACKGRFYGGPYLAAPAGRLDQPRLEVCVLPRCGMAGLLRYGFALPMNRLPDLPGVRMLSARRLLVTGERGAPVQADGEIVARLPAEIAVAEETVELVMPVD